MIITPQLGPHDYIIATAPILHPETQGELVREGDWLQLYDIEFLAEEYGVDEIVGHVVRWPEVKEMMRKNIRIPG